MLLDQRTHAGEASAAHQVPGGGVSGAVPNGGDEGPRPHPRRLQDVRAGRQLPSHRAGRPPPPQPAVGRGACLTLTLTLTRSLTLVRES